MQKTCIHRVAPFFRAAEPNDPPCGKPAFTRRTHGFLCIGHYKAEQDSIPAKPRQPQPRWKGLQPVVQDDVEIIADIIATDKQAIAVGKIVSYKFGKFDPVYLRVLAAPMVH